MDLCNLIKKRGMIMYFKILLSAGFIFFTVNSSLYSQDTVSAKYFPLNTGNVWIYSVQSFPPMPFPYYIYKIERDSVFNNYRYFLYKGYNISQFSSEWIRYDSATGNLLAYSTNGGCSGFANDKIIDSLSSTPGDIINCNYQVFMTRQCISVIIISVFNNIPTELKEFKHDGLIYNLTRYAKNFGIFYSCSGDPPPCSGYSTLIGCIINGVVFGDTTVTGIVIANPVIPEKFSLSPNYPNPFNPKTIINYDLPVASFVSLKVFNILGKEVSSLVNEMQNAGSYSVEFNGDGLAGGVYFYRMEAGEFIGTKRMVLLK